MAVWFLSDGGDINRTPRTAQGTSIPDTGSDLSANFSLYTVLSLQNGPSTDSTRLVLFNPGRIADCKIPSYFNWYNWKGQEAVQRKEETALYKMEKESNWFTKEKTDQAIRKTKVKTGSESKVCSQCGFFQMAEMINRTPRIVQGTSIPDTGSDPSANFSLLFFLCRMGRRGIMGSGVTLRDLYYDTQEHWLDLKYNPDFVGTSENAGSRSKKRRNSFI